MLRRVSSKTPKSAEAFAIVASEYNPRYVNAMVRAAREVLKSAGVRQVELLRVPGAFEIPIVAARLAGCAERPVAAVICLGVILRGQTEHASLIGEAVTRALMNLQIECQVPVIHEVLLLENEAQARVRCLSKQHNRGAEAAQTALAMARVMRALQRA